MYGVNFDRPAPSGTGLKTIESIKGFTAKGTILPCKGYGLTCGTCVTFSPWIWPVIFYVTINI